MVPTSLLLYCRPGFEKECAAEIVERAAQAGFPGFCRAQDRSGLVQFVPFSPDHAAALAKMIPFHSLVFARQMVSAGDLVTGLPQGERLGPLIEMLGGVEVSEFVLETPDTNEAKELQSLCRKLAPPLRAELQRRSMLREGERRLPRLHLLFTSSTSAYVALSYRDNSSPWPMGIPRLRFPSGAPSRSTLKLEEAFLTFLSDKEREQRLRPGMSAVDLGAAPGGWTFQFVRRHLRVIAVDNGPMDQALLDSGLVDHRREDGFRFRPQKGVDWMVCDMVEQPVRIARLVADWVAEGRCRETIFNLKLPMKKRWQELQRCEGVIRERLDAEGLRYELAFKQLYHDREEVTGHLRRV